MKNTRNQPSSEAIRAPVGISLFLLDRGEVPVALHTQMVERVRERVIQVRVTEAEFEMTEDLVNQTGLSKSDVIRQLIRKAHQELPKTRKK